MTRATTPAPSIASARLQATRGGESAASVHAGSSDTSIPAQKRGSLFLVFPEKSLEKRRAKGRRDSRRDYAKNYELWKAQGRERKARERAATAEARAAAKVAKVAARAASHAANPNHHREVQKAWRLANPGYMSKWRALNWEKVRAAKRLRKASKRQTLVRDLTKLQRGRCAYCRVRLNNDRHVDHVRPLSRGGPDVRSNLQLTCAPCNMAKGAMDPVVFAQSIGRLL